MSRVKMPNPIAGQSRMVTLQYHPTDTTRADRRGWSVDALILKPLPFLLCKDTAEHVRVRGIYSFVRGTQMLFFSSSHRRSDD